MGRSYFVDRDYYLIDDGVYGNKLQNDLRHPDRIIREGDRFGYDYDLRRNEIGAGGSLEYRADRLARCRTERTADCADLAPPPFDYAPDVAGNDAGAARFRCPTEKG